MRNLISCFVILLYLLNILLLQSGICQKWDARSEMSKCARQTTLLNYNLFFQIVYNFNLHALFKNTKIITNFITKIIAFCRLPLFLFPPLQLSPSPSFPISLSLFPPLPLSLNYDFCQRTEAGVTGISPPGISPPGAKSLGISPWGGECFRKLGEIPTDSCPLKESRLTRSM